MSFSLLGNAQELFDKVDVLLRPRGSSGASSPGTGSGLTTSHASCHRLGRSRLWEGGGMPAECSALLPLNEAQGSSLSLPTSSHSCSCLVASCRCRPCVPASGLGGRRNPASVWVCSLPIPHGPPPPGLHTPTHATLAFGCRDQTPDVTRPCPAGRRESTESLQLLVHAWSCPLFQIDARATRGWGRA